MPDLSLDLLYKGIKVCLFYKGKPLLCLTIVEYM